MSFSFNARKKITTLQKDFKKEFGLTLRLYDGSSFADPNQTVMDIRKKKGAGNNLSVAKNMRIGSLEKKIDKEYGLKVQIAGSDNSYLCKDELTLNGARVEDEKKLGRKAKKASKEVGSKPTSGDDWEPDLDSVLDEMEAEMEAEMDAGTDEVAGESEGKNYFINCDKSRDACSIDWASEDYNIKDLEPYIYAIECDDGEDFYDLIHKDWPDADGRNDFKLIELDKFEAVDGDVDNQYYLCFTALINVNLDNHPEFKKALKKADNKIVARIQFKKDGKPILDSDGYEEYLYDFNEDVPVELELDE